MALAPGGADAAPLRGAETGSKVVGILFGWSRCVSVPWLSHFHWRGWTWRLQWRSKDVRSRVWGFLGEVGWDEVHILSYLILSLLTIDCRLGADSAALARVMDCV